MFKKDIRKRRLRVEQLEARRLLAFVVDSVADVVDGDLSAGNLSLREAIQLANATPGPDTILFSPDLYDDSLRHMELALGELEVTESLHIDASDGGRVSIDANDTSRILHYSALTGDLALTNLHVFRGKTIGDGSAYGGGGIRFDSAGRLSITDSVFASNEATRGGAVYSIGPVEIRRSVFIENRASRYGGAIFTQSGDVFGEDSEFSANRTLDFAGGGGAIWSSGGLTLRRALVSNNQTEGDVSPGGGMWSRSLVLVDSVVSGNNTSGVRSEGGGFVTDHAGLVVVGSLIRGNFTLGGSSYGGGFHSDSRNGEILSTTISGNWTQGHGSVGGGFTHQGGGVLTIRDSTIRENVTLGDQAVGGGFQSDSRIGELFNTTIYGNRTEGEASDGGGFLHEGRELLLKNSTISHNETLGGANGGGFIASSGQIYNSTIINNAANDAVGRVFGAGGFRAIDDFLIVNSILAGNRAGNYPEGWFNRQPEVSHTIIGDNTGTQIPSSELPDEFGNLVGTGANPMDPGLEPIADNGGPTLTHMPMPDSVAINAGDIDSTVSVTDQRGVGFTRFVGGNPDIGSVEYGATYDVRGDFNLDGLRDCLDVDSLLAEIVSGGDATEFDLNEDMVVDREDLDVWLETAAAAHGLASAYRYGDYNLDGVVDVSDFNVWNEYKFTSVSGWCSGDGSADGQVDVSDFNLWNENKFASSDTAIRSDYHGGFTGMPFGTNQDTRRLESDRVRAVINRVFAE